MKTIIQVWTHSCYNKLSDKHNNFWGIGDILRGTLNLYLFCIKNNYNFIVDIHLHNLSKYIIQNNHPFINLIEKNKDKIPFIEGCDIINYINNNNDDVIFLFTNFNQEIYNLTEETKKFMNNLLKPNKEFELYINNYLNNLNNFNIIHFRLGDDELVRNNKNLDYEKYLNILKNINFNKNDILISDSVSFKEFIKNKNINISLFDTSPKHIGLNNDLKDTLFEFFLLKNANKIYSYSIYCWESGFVKWNSIIFDKNVEFIK
jgi:hypothetical protein